MAKIRLKHVNSFYDRHGRLRHVCRIPGRRSFTLPGLPGSADFMDTYQAALGGAPIPPTEIGASRTKAGTFNAAIVAYRARDRHPAHAAQHSGALPQGSR